MEKTTKREMYTTIKTLLAERTDVVEFCDNEIALLDKKAAKAKENAAKKKAEGDALMERVYEVLTDEFQPISAIVTTLDDEEVTTSKVVARLTALIKAERVEKSEVSVSVGDKTKKVMGYRRLA